MVYVRRQRAELDKKIKTRRRSSWTGERRAPRRVRCAPHSGKPDCLRRGVSKHRVVAVAVLVGCRVAARCPARSPASCVKPLVGLTCRIVHATWPCTAVGSCGGGSRDCQPRVPSACRALPSVPTLVWSRAAATLHQSTCPLFG